MNLRSRLANRSIGLLALAVVSGLAVTFAISYRVFGGSIEDMAATPGYPGVLFINALVGMSVALFVAELRWDALRVIVTVGVALIFGFLVTAASNLDAANRFAQGEFTVRLESEAEPIENEDMDIAYGRQRGDEFDGASLTEAAYRFEGRAGDVVNILAFAANRRSQVNLEVELLDANGEPLARATSATPEQLQTYDDLISENDAVIEGYALPAEGIYTIRARPEPVGGDVVLRETMTETELAYNAFLLGPLDRVNRWAIWIQDAITLIMLGLAIAIVFSARQFSLGAEGQLYFGALLSGTVALTLTNAPPIVAIPLALLAAIIGGFLWGLLPGALKAYLGANELVSTLMLNVVASRFYELVLTFQLKPPDAGYAASDWFPTAAQFQPIVPDTQVTVGVFLLLIVVVAVWLLVRRTAIGYEIRMIGANIRFADYGGINTRRTIMLAMAISGVVAGLAGAHLAMGIHRKLILNISVGLGFEGIVVALLARNNPLVIPFTGLLYSYMRAGAQFMERDANVSFEVVRIIQAVIILLITAEALLAYFRRQRVRRRGTIDLSIEQPLGPPLPAEEGTHG